MGCDASNPSVVVSECWLDVEGEQIFVRLWNPLKVESELSSVLLLHDSLGSVELWRDFPERIAVATGRQVIAYDRLGFGRSSARSSLPSLDFVAAEAREIFPELLRQLGLKQVLSRPKQPLSIPLCCGA